MKNLRLGLVALILSPIMAFAGSESGGGGDMLPSTPASIKDIRENLKTINDQGYAGFLRLKLQITNPDYFDGQDHNISHKPVIEKIMKTFSDRQIKEKFYDVAIDLKEQGRCLDQGQERDASADPLNNRICFNLVRLAKKNIPFHDLSFKLTALMIHEVGHLLMLNEADATLLQTAFESYGKMITPAQIIKYKKKIGFDVGYDTQDLINDILEKINKNTPDNLLCFKIGQLDGFGLGNLVAIRDAYTVFGSVIFSENALTLNDHILERVESIDNYCGQSGEGPIPDVSQGNRKELKKALETLKIEMKRLFIEATSSPFAINCKENWTCD